jgi:hypothetical protein
MDHRCNNCASWPSQGTKWSPTTIHLDSLHQTSTMKGYCHFWLRPAALWAFIQGRQRIEHIKRKYNYLYPSLLRECHQPFKALCEFEPPLAVVGLQSTSSVWWRYWQQLEGCITNTNPGVNHWYTSNFHRNRKWHGKNLLLAAITWGLFHWEDPRPRTPKDKVGHVNHAEGMGAETVWTLFDYMIILILFINLLPLLCCIII